MAFADIDAARLSHFNSLGFSPSCIFDVGASNGTWSWVMRSVFPDATFHLFEPLAERHEPYRQMLADYVAKGLRGHVHATALGASSGTTTFGIGQDSYSSSMLVSTASETFPKVEAVPIATIDDLVSIGAVPQPQLVKMDTQGGELEALKGATDTLKHVDVLLLETWLGRGYGPKTPLYAEVANWLAAHGFFLLDVGDCYRDADGILMAQDFFFVNERTPVVRLRANRSYIAA